MWWCGCGNRPIYLNFWLFPRPVLALSGPTTFTEGDGSIIVGYYCLDPSEKLRPLPPDNAKNESVAMDDREKRALGAMALMVKQYLEVRPDGLIDSLAMTAGERAIGSLSDFGYMETVVLGRVFGRWTEAGRALCQWSFDEAIKPPST